MNNNLQHWELVRIDSTVVLSEYAYHAPEGNS